MHDTDHAPTVWAAVPVDHAGPRPVPADRADDYDVLFAAGDGPGVRFTCAQTDVG